ncbi:hypothetical protein GCK72_019722 [Caenorhabditis remanei]|uniref:CHK kinase-like domain-containing protein n=1 Tax=Caenorhabditis remanei TaxID=31234 RepID=A0A6A5GEP5_CAERE|nr:hypothetical protein GCK72_019722 [Caenorhabditis remanei]KAF1753166.1 hypothetical protein GCK72_019722 [Caenorhabditis remanei]
MTLYQPSTGILETHVTWQDVEEDMQKALGTEAIFGPNKKATNIGDMKGFMSRIALIDPDWQSVEKNENLPTKFAVKISSQLAHVALSNVIGTDEFSEEKLEHMSTFTRKFHNQEVEAYKCLMKFDHPDIPYTKVYALKPFLNDTDLKGYMIFDFVSNVYAMGMHQSIPAEDLTQLIRGVATFSALGESLTPEETQLFGGPEFLEIGLSEFFGEEQLEKLFGNMRSSFEIEHSEIVEKAIPIFRHYTKLLKNYSKISELLGFKLVLNHCDLWQSNMLHSMGDDGKLKLEAIIDWQGVSRLSVGFGLARVFAGCLSARDRRKHGLSLLSLYQKTFTEVHGKELFSLQELQDAYNLHLPIKAMILVPLILPFLDAQTSEKEKEKYHEENVAKLVALMEDVLIVHDYNLKKHPEFMKI